MSENQAKRVTPETASPMPSSPSTTPKKGRLMGCVAKTAILLAILAAIIFGSYQLKKSRAQNELVAAMDELRANGLPATVEDLQKNYQPLAGQLETTKQWIIPLPTFSSDEYQSSGSKLPIIGNAPNPPVPPAQWSQAFPVLDFVRKYEPQLIELQMASMGFGFLPTDFANQTQLPEDTITQLYRGFHLLELNCYAQGHHQNRQAFINSIMACARYSNCLAKHPGHQRERFELEKMGYQLLATFLHRTELTEQELKDLFLILYERDPWQGIGSYWNMQRAGRMMMYTDVQKFKKSGLSEQLRTDRDWESFWNNIDLNMVTSPFVAEDADRFLELMNRIELNFQGNLVQQASKLEELVSSIRHEQLSGLDRFRYPTAQYMIPPVSHLIRTAGQADAMRQVILATIAADLFRLKSDRFPKELAELIPEYLNELPIDLYSGNPLQMLIDRDDLVIYNVGPNKKDDKGKNTGGAKDDQLARLAIQKWTPGGDSSLKID